MRTHNEQMFRIARPPRRWYNVLAMGCTSSGVYQKPFGAGDVSPVCLTRGISVTPGGFFKLMVEKSTNLTYNTLIRTVGRWMRLTRPGENLKLNYKNSRSLCRERDVYFLFFKLRIATISKAIVSKICISSNVLIIITTFLQDARNGVRARPPVARINVLCCQGAMCFFKIREWTF